MLKPRTSVASSRSTTSALLSVIVGRLAASALCSASEPTVSVAASPISFRLALRLIPLA
jgi:hypothetical protein